MSHKANYWLASLDPSQVKAGAFRVLFHLCDHHNDELDPSASCYPSQETLMRKTGLSNGALNNALNDMEAAGLIRRRRSTVPGSSERRTYYILGCDAEIAARQTPENGDSSNSTTMETAAKQTPVSGQANSILGPSKLQPTGEEPVRTGKNQAAAAREASQQSDMTRRERLLAALGADPMSGIMGASGTMLGTAADMQAADGWAELGLSLDRQCMVLSERMAQIVARQPHFVPRRFSYFTGAMQDAAAAKAAPRATNPQQSDRDRKRASWRKIAGRPTEGATA